ncbi:d74faeae-aa32-4c73-81b2-b779767a786d [Thermothielavioides terrestris]|uniref:Early meiotic induction protein 1 n=2 Tax=Thermothielavioides terrestris TaxID=2587410 RepID=G2RGG1_THETT|nr:uncharacterized protein THITE_2156505 [Thermothielavioides terrestris NRRL 8126]AEO71046.1 hypothetical protein THITE_2156505 [Thermothielavioides terrestris NRRL 8126]SPQ20611.1 d74faeae-aa32-4c73-81b2-b779767a786d [Thermothielavioides terrestris]
MGWFWQPSPSPKPQPEGSSDSPAVASSTAAPPAATQRPPAESQSGPEPDAAERELALFMHMLLKDTQSSSSSSSSQPSAQQEQQQQQPPQTPSSTSKPEPPSSWFSWASARSRGEPPAAGPSSEQQQDQQPSKAGSKPPRTRTPQSLAMSEHLLPTSMSCRDAFDYAWHCHTPGAQWNAVYRYGSVRPCTELWDDFWFCMRTKSLAPAARAEAVRAHYRAKEAAKYGGGRPSSEDVWESRDERVAPGTAFQAKFEPPIADDDEFRRADAERRRRIREAMGAEKGEQGREGSERR